MTGMLLSSPHQVYSPSNSANNSTLATPQASFDVWDQLMKVFRDLPAASPSHVADDVWERLWEQVKIIEDRHAKYDDVETPRLPNAVIQGARRLIRRLEEAGELPPTVMTGTCDATITLEWHHWDGPRSFRSFDVLNENEAEVFIMESNGRKTLETIPF